MASPFSVFRKHQKFLMALACLLAIIAFVFLPILGETLGLRSRRPVNKVVVTSKYGDLRETDVNALLQEHRRVLGVLTDVRQMSGEYGLLARQRAEAMIGPATEEQVVNSWLLARYAQQLGMVVSDEQINAFLKRWTRDVVKRAEFQAAFKRSGLSEIQFFNLMRDELLAQQLQQMFYVSLEGITPAERWDYFTRVKQMATIEAVPVAVANYVARVDEPSDEELKAFFDEHKEEYSLPDSPEPGFREPQRVALQWFKADQEKFLAQVTDEEIKQRYEKNKDLYDQSEKKPEAKQPEEERKKSHPRRTPRPRRKSKKKDSKDSRWSAPGRRAADKPPGSAGRQEAPGRGRQPRRRRSRLAPKPPSTAEKPAAAKPGLAEATKNRIRREIADEKILKIFENLREQMDQYRSQWSQYEVAVIHQQSRKENEKGKTVAPAASAPTGFRETGEGKRAFDRADAVGLAMGSRGPCRSAPRWLTVETPSGITPF